MRKPLTSTAVALVLLAVPATASAAQVGITPAKRCYRSGEQARFLGNGFTPGGAVNVTSDSSSIGSLLVDSRGIFDGALRFGQRSGQRKKTYTATDQRNPAIAGSVNLLVSSLNVNVRPRSGGRPGRRLRIRARGFTTGKRLYAHIRRGRRYRRNVRVGRLKGACRTLRTRKRLFGRRTRNGRYLVQFDTRRRYSRRTRVRVRYTATFFTTFGARAAAGPTWKALP